MSDNNYEIKLKSVQRFIPFLENMIEQLKGPKMKNREQQLKKMQVLHGMITDDKKKLKEDTLVKCEDVIVKLYQKVKGQTAALPEYSTEKKERKTIDIYSMAGKSLNDRKKYDEFDILPSSSKDKESDRFQRKLPVSYADLENIEKDVASELEKKMSLKQLKYLRNELCQQLEKTNDQISTTIKSDTILNKTNNSASDKGENNLPVSKYDKNETNSLNSKKNVVSKNANANIIRGLREAGELFENAFQEIDKSYELTAKKREERKNSKTKDIKQNDQLLFIEEKTAAVRQLAEKAAELRRKTNPVNITVPINKPQEETQSALSDKINQAFPSPIPEVSLDKPISSFVEEFSKKVHEEKEEKISRVSTDNKQFKEKEKNIQDTQKDRNKVEPKSKTEKKKNDENEKVELSNGRNDNMKRLEKKSNTSEAASKDKKNRDPRLKSSSNTSPQDIVDRLASKYNPKIRKQDQDIEIEKNLLDSIEKSMKESNMPLPPPAQLSAPPAPPDDLFSPESPDEIDKAPVHPIVNNLLLNSNTTIVINEVVTAIKRSNNDKNISPLGDSMLNYNEISAPGLFTDSFRSSQRQDSQFSSANNRNPYVTPSTDGSNFFQHKSMNHVVQNNSQPRGFNPFTTTEQNYSNNDMSLNNYQRNTSLHSYENRMGFNERGLNFVPPTNNERGLNFLSPSQSFVPPSPSYAQPTPTYAPPANYMRSPNYVPPSPGYVAPSPMYDDNEIHVNSYFQGDRGLSQNFMEHERVGTNRQRGILGDFPQRLPFKSQYGNQNYENYYNQNNFMDNRKQFYGGTSRDPRIRGAQFSGNRMCGRDNAMTYREYREQRERENRERERENRERERENRGREKENSEKEAREKENASDKKINTAEPVVEQTQVVDEKKDEQIHNEQRTEPIEKEKENTDLKKNENETKDKSHSRDSGRSVERNSDKRSRARSSSRYRRRSRSRDRTESKHRDSERRRRENRESDKKSRSNESKFDKVYSSREKDKGDFTSPLDSLYAPSKSKTGKGYGIQFKIPKKVKESDKPQKEENSASNKVESKEKNKEEKEEQNAVENEVQEKKDTDENEEKSTKQAESKKVSVEQTAGVSEETALPSTEETDISKDTLEEVKDKANPKMNKDEESILTKFFQNLMKSGNKDEKKVALLSLISTFSESLSQNELETITTVLKSGKETTEEQEIVSSKEDSKKEEIQTEETPTKIDETDKKEDELNVISNVEADKNIEDISKSDSFKSDSTKPESKQKIKIKTELDRLHDDIREMFIRDGVVTATGKRMCRILKDKLSPTNTDEVKQLPNSNIEDTKKKKGKTKKANVKKKQVVPMKELCIRLPIMSLDTAEDKEETEKRYSLRKQAKPAKYTDNEAEDKGNKKLDETLQTENVEKECEKSPNEELKKVKVKKKVKNAWATGVIKKKASSKLKKSQVNKIEENQVKKDDETDNVNTDDIESVQEKESTDNNETIEKVDTTGTDKSFKTLHDKNYYFRSNKTCLKCKVCPVSTKWIAAHYRSEHPDMEVLSARLPPHIAEIAIEDAIENKQIYEADNSLSTSKSNFTCVFCEYNLTTLPRLCRDHIAIHTGEFRHKCPYCNYQRSHIKSIQTHVSEAHATEEATSNKRIVSQIGENHKHVYGYLCKLCNFVQMSSETVQNHIIINHPESENCIYKIMLNSIAYKTKEKTESPEIPSERKTRRSIQKHNTSVDNDSEKVNLNIEDEKSNESSLKIEENQNETLPNKIISKRRKSLSFNEQPKKKIEIDVKEIEPDEIKKIDKAVFTCNTDLQEENKLIEEERLKTMQDINSSIKPRTSLDFIEKLSNRLKLEDVNVKVKIKKELQDNDDCVDESSTPNKLPVFEKSVLLKREEPPNLIRQDSCKIPKESKGNTMITGVIEKLQGILSVPFDSPTDTPPETSITPDITSNPPPLTHMNEISTAHRPSNSEILNIGPIKIIKSEGTSIFSCCSPPCIFSTRDQSVFWTHCMWNHTWNANSDKFPTCKECDMKLEFDEGTPLLISAWNHAKKQHNDFLGIQIGSIRVSNNLFPSCDEKDTSSDEPSTLEQNNLNTTEEPLINENDNPFSFKIVDVVSLADEDNNTSIGIIEDENNKNENIESTTQPELTQNTQEIEKPTNSQIKIKKSSNAIKKFLNTPNDLFKCPEFSCLFTTNKKNMFDVHVKTHQNLLSLTNCIYCDKCVLVEKLGEHYEQIHGRCKFACSYCMYRCIVKDYLDVHHAVAHSNLPNTPHIFQRSNEEKNITSGFCDINKSATISLYKCCNKSFLFYDKFIQHLENCSENVHNKCYATVAKKLCNAVHLSTMELATHWSECHGIYPLKCGYCDVGSFILSELMIHLVEAHPALPPDLIDRRVQTNQNKYKNASNPPRAQCNFSQLLLEFNNDPTSIKLPNSSDTESGVISSNNLTHSIQKAYENVVHTQCPTTSTKAVTTYSKITPVNYVPTTTSATISQISTKSPIKSNRSPPGLVYCLSQSSTNPSQIVKAIVVNKDNPAPQVRLLSPVSIQPSDTKFKMIKKGVRKILPLPTNVPKLTTIGTVQRLVPLAVPIVQTVSSKIVNSSKDSNEILAINEISEKIDNNEFCDKDEDLVNLEEPMMIINEDLCDNSQEDAVDPLSLEHEDPPITTKEKSESNQMYIESTPNHEYDSDSKETESQESQVQKIDLRGHSLHRCAKCDAYFPDSIEFKDHLIKSSQCKYDNAIHKPYKCVHCGKFMKHYNNLLDHMNYHGHLKYLCSLCNEKFRHPYLVKQHMKGKHNVVNIIMHNTKKNNSDSDIEFVVKPMTSGIIRTPIKDTNDNEHQKTDNTKVIFYSHEIDNLPQKSILSYDVTCGHCKKFKNKVRSNIIRHLQLHQNDKDFTVPDTAPVNPVPCLEKNEKMFDKMYNLASSSHVGGRMGNQPKSDGKVIKTVEETYPAFVPTNKRFQCCAVGCNYLCLEEGNLRHHLTALHMEDLKFVCVHCKKDLSDAIDVDTILKHLKLHELHLYKCSRCDFMHNLRHKIKRHIGEKHKAKECGVIVVRAMDSEPYDDNHPAHTPYPVAINQKTYKPWRCCICKYRCHTQEEAEIHAKNKHDIDSRYKCSLCAFKSDDSTDIKNHFESKHEHQDFDIILSYCREEEVVESSSENDQFDTTPLWLRDKPRIRHIRGILFEDSSSKKKTSPLKNVNDQNINGSSSPATKKRKRSMSTISESRNNESESEFKKEIEIISNEKSDIITIDDDEDDDLKLKNHFSEMNIPTNKYYKCPQCDRFESTKMRDFMQHVAAEIKYFRFKCKLCLEKFVLLESIQSHCIDFHNSEPDNFITLPVIERVKKWLLRLLQKQRDKIKSLGFPTENLPENIDNFFMYSNQTSEDNYYHPSLDTSSDNVKKVNEPSSRPSSSQKRSLQQDDIKTNTKKVKTSLGNSTNLKDKYICGICHAGFDSVQEIESHGKNSHDNRIKYVIQPSDVLTTGEYGRNNMYRCLHCNVVGPKPILENHFKIKHQSKTFGVYKFSCGVCKMKFEFQPGLKNHFKIHQPTPLFYFNIYDEKITPRIRSTSNMKIYSCPSCAYTSHSQTGANIKTHLKLHAKPYQCDLCKAEFKFRPDAKAHHLKEHPHNNESIVERKEMFQKIEELMKEVLKNVVNKEVDENPTNENQNKNIVQKTKSFARKSTSSLAKPKETTNFYSFYGQKPEEIDLKNIITTFDIGDTKMRMTCDQLSKIYNLKPSISLVDCFTLILSEEGDEEDDDDDSS